MPKAINTVEQKAKHLQNLKKKYDTEKRSQKPISFNRNSEADLLMVADRMNLSVWVKTLLGSFTQSEISLLGKDSIDMVPAVLVEKAIENQFFLLEEYLAAKGKKIVDIDEAPKKSGFMNSMPEAFDEYNQEYPG